MKLTIHPKRGKRQVVEATPEAVEAALRKVGDTVHSIIVESRMGPFLSTNGGPLEYVDNVPFKYRRFRAGNGDMSFQDTLRVLVAFAASEDWHELCEWKAADLVRPLIACALVSTR